MDESHAAPAAVVSLITLGVNDLPGATEFYRELGFALSGASVEGEVSFFRTAGVVLALWHADALAEEAGRPGQRPASGVALAMNLDSAAAVDAMLRRAEALGAVISRPARATDWGGYSGYFADRDGHAWEIAHNPFWPLDERGLPRLP